MRNRRWGGEKENAGKLGMVWGSEDETDVELKKDKEEMKRETVRWMDAWRRNRKRQMEKCREGYIAGRLSVQHMVRVRDRKQRRMAAEIN